jgi:hypothetical protein
LADRLPAAQSENALARAVRPLVVRLRETASASEFATIAGTLELVAGRLAEEDALAAMKLVRKARRGLDLPPLAEACRAVLARLPAGAAATHAEALARHIVGAAEKTTSPLDLISLARSLRSISPHLPPASRQPEAFIDRLFRAWEESPREFLTEQAAEAIQAVAPLLPEAPAGRCADRVLAALQQADPAPISSAQKGVLAEVHEALLQRLPGDRAGPRRVTAILACIRPQATMHPRERDYWRRRGEPSAQAALPAYLSPLVAACTPDDLVEVLRSPACTGDVEAWFLTELGRRSGCPFRSVWDVIDKLELAGGGAKGRTE